jgi:hypothetical protein
MSDIYEMDIMEVDRQYGPLLESYYSRLGRILEEVGGDFDKASDKDKMIIEKMEAVLTVMQERLIEAGLIEDINNNIEEDDNMNRNDKLVERFFDILENGGNWTEMYLIRDLLMNEYINGAFSQVEIVQIDDILQESLERELEENEPVIEMYYLDDIVTNIYKAIDRGDLDGAFALTNAYGDNAQSNPYMYYCAVRELERVTGENYIELCI